MRFMSSRGSGPAMGFSSQILGGWQLSSIFQIASGTPVRVTQASGLANSRPDFVGGTAVNANWRDNSPFQYLNPAAWAAVPVCSATTAPIRSGTSNPHDVYGPGRW